MQLTKQQEASIVEYANTVMLGEVTEKEWDYCFSDLLIENDEMDLEWVMVLWGEADTKREQLLDENCVGFTTEMIKAAVEYCTYALYAIDLDDECVLELANRLINERFN